jgi:hypothetical protein
MRRVPAWVIAAVLAAAYLLLDPPSADLAAQEYRTGLFRHHGFALWDNAWYAGHHLPGYSLVFPPVAAVLGPKLTGALAAVASAWCFERLARDRLAEGARAAALWFAAATPVSLITGRLTFALGVAVGLAALLAASRARARGRAGVAAAGALAVLTGLTSPVAGAFLALAAIAWWIPGGNGAGGAARRSRPTAAAAALTAGALIPVAALSVAFPEGGSFPFASSSFWPALAATLVVLAVLPREPRAVRAGTALYALALVASFALDTPMGGNAARLGALLAGPLAAGVLWPRRPRALLALALPLIYWQWVAPVDDWHRAAGDRSTDLVFHHGLIGFLERDARDNGPLRVEIPFTDNHWESRFVAPHAGLARGWERQLDRARNGLFYDGAPLTATRYERWLRDNAVRFVALPHAPLDPSAAAEAQLIRGGLPYLRPVWRDGNYRVFAVTRAPPLASGAQVTALSADSVTLRAARPGRVVVRVRFTPYWALVRGAGCVARSAGGWTEIRLAEPGAIRLQTRFAPGRVRARSPRCTPGVA